MTLPSLPYLPDMGAKETTQLRVLTAAWTVYKLHTECKTELAIDKWIKQRKGVAVKYNKLLKNVPQIQLPKLRNSVIMSIIFFVIKSDQRNKLKEHLLCKGISTVVNYPKALPFVLHMDI